MSDDTKEKLTAWGRILKEIWAQLIKVAVLGVFGMVAVLFADHQSVKQNSQFREGQAEHNEKLDIKVEALEDNYDSLRFVVKHLQESGDETNEIVKELRLQMFKLRLEIKSIK